MTIRRICTGAVSFMVAAFLLACQPPIFGDPGAQDVDLHNATPVPVHVWAGQRRDAPGRRLAPGETWEDQWLVPRPRQGKPPSGSRIVEARDDAGDLVFCHRYTFEE